MFEMELQNKEVISFICQSSSDLNKWVSLINLVLSSDVSFLFMNELGLVCFKFTNFLFIS